MTNRRNADSIDVISSMQHDVKQRLKTAAKAFVSIALLFWLFTRIDAAEFFATLRELPWWAVTGAFALVLASQCLGALRLKLLLQSQAIVVSFAYAVYLTFVGLFVGNFLPGTVGGDVMKVVLLGRRGHRKSIATACVVVDRLINMAAMCLLLPTVLSIAGIFNIKARTLLPPAMIFLLSAIMAAIFLGPRLLRFLVAYTGRHDPSDPSFLARMGRALHGLLRMLQKWAHAPWQLAGYLAISALLIAASILSMWTITLSLGVPITFPEFVAVVVLVYFAAQIPISLNGLGIAEAGFVYLFTQLGMPPESALTIAAMNRLLYIAASAAGGTLFAAMRNTLPAES
jgi:uncharacterized protein (TIRG00374 family)